MGEQDRADVGQLQQSSLGEGEIAGLPPTPEKQYFQSYGYKDTPKSLVIFFVILYSDCDLFDAGILVPGKWLIIPVTPFTPLDEQELA